MATPSQTHWHIASRIGAGIFGSYAFTWGFVALATTLLLSAGVDFHGATELPWMLGFLVYLVAFLYAFISASLPRVWLMLAGGGALMTLAGWWLSKSLA